MNRLSTALITTGTTAAAAIVIGSAPATAEAPRQVAQVNLGDSFAGHGGDTNPLEGTDMSAYEQDTIIPDVNECHRLKLGYSALVADSLDNSYINAACAGATTEDILTRHQWGDQPPQIESLSPDTKLVTVQIGGNDAGFEALVQKVTLGELTQDSLEYTQAIKVLEDKEQLPDSLDRVYQAIREEAPEAEIVVSLYDDPLPTVANSLATPNLCPYITPAELELSRTFLNKLNETIRAAAGRAALTLVEPTKWADQKDMAGLPRDACSFSLAAAYWSSARFAEFDPNSTNFGWHPTANTHYAQADKIIAALDAK